MPSNNNQTIVSPERAPRNLAGTPAENEAENPPIVEGEHIPLFHTGEALPAPLGNVSKALHRTGYAALRAQANQFFTFLAPPNPALLKVNEGTVSYVALVNIPKSNKVKVFFLPWLWLQSSWQSCLSY